jgi:Tol biopolymer transport system component
MRTIATDTRSVALVALTLIAVTACQNDGPIEPARLPNSHRTSAMIRLKPPFNGILFQGNHDARTGEIYSINPDGTGLVRLTNDTVTDASPDVSPNGPAFIWTRYGADGQSSEIYSQNIDGTNRKQLTFLGSATSARYSPNGLKIVFSALTSQSGSEIFTMNADGTGLEQLTTSGRNSTNPSWSLDGSKIAFRSNNSNGIATVWVMNASGSGQAMLKTCAAPGCDHPRWSPVTNEIAVDHIDGTGIFVIDGTTGTQTGLIPGAQSDVMPTWSNDGLRIIFSSQRSGNGTFDLFSTQPVRRSPLKPPPADRLTTLLGNEMSPAYSH